MNRNFIWLVLLMILWIAGCSGDGDLNNKQIEVDEDVVLNMLPSFSRSDVGLLFSFQSDALYNCDDVGFTYALKTTTGDIAIHLLGINIPDVCAGGNAPAFETIGVPSEEGSYSISIDIGEVIHNTGLLIIDPSGYQILMSSQYGMSIPFLKMYRIPEGTIWGYVHVADETKQTETMSLVQDALASISTKANVSAGYYGYFNVDQPSSIYTLYPAYYPESNCFILHLQEEYPVLEQTVEHIRSQLSPDADFRVFTWQGREL